MMTIDPFQDDLKAYADGELPWLRRLAIRRHLTQCASCQEGISHMTQIAEDLRESETDAALPADLRAKILAGIPGAYAPGAGSAGLLGENPSGVEDEAAANPSSVPEGLPSGRPALPAPGHRKRPALGWAIASVALIAWFVFFPMFQRVQEHARWHVVGSAAGLNSPSAVETASVPFAQPKAAFKPSPPGATAPGAYARSSPEEVASLPVSSVKSAYKPESASLASPPDALKPLPETPDVATDSLRQVHKEASIGVQVANPETTSDTVETMVTATGGYVAANNLSTGDDGMKTAELIVKVPVAQFETFLSQVAKLGNVQSKNITGEDITEKTSDADQTEGVLEDDVQKSEARLKALGSKAKWRDEEATRELRIQLAQAQARLVLLKRMAALGTLTIDLSQTPKAVPPPPVTGGFLNGLKASTHDALLSLMNSASALIALVIWLLAYAPLWIPLLLVGRYALKEYRKRAVV